MACVTLKRPLALTDHHFEGPHHHNAPAGASPASPHHHHRPPPSKRRRCVPLSAQQREQERELYESGGVSFPSFPASPALGAGSSSGSVFREAPLSAEAIANNLRDELKRLKKRRQLVAPYNTTPPRNAMLRGGSPPKSPPSSPEPMIDHADLNRLASASSPMQRSAAGSAGASGIFNNQREKPIFTLKQMSLICERMCKERTDQVREEYDRILHQKLAEQYDAFVKFIDHQIQRRFTEAQLPSYLS